MQETDERDKTLLVVEDDTFNREELTMMLQQEGYRVVAAENGQEALEYLRPGPLPDLILLDMLMPVLDGWHFLECLQKVVPVPIPILITTGTILTREWAAAKGCAGFLRKPFDAESLFAEIQRCLGSAA